MTRRPDPAPFDLSIAIARSVLAVVLALVLPFVIWGPSPLLEVMPVFLPFLLLAVVLAGIGRGRPRLWWTVIIVSNVLIGILGFSLLSGSNEGSGLVVPVIGYLLLAGTLGAWLGAWFACFAFDVWTANARPLSGGES